MNEIPRHLEASRNGSSTVTGLHSRARLRLFKDRSAGWVVRAGGMFVLVAILLIFFYLLYEVLPLFRGASAEMVAEYQVATATDGGGDSPSLLVAMEEQAEIGLRLNAAGQAAFFRLKSGQPIKQTALSIPAGAGITSFGLDSPQSRLFALGLDSGAVLLARHDYDVTFAPEGRVLTPEIEYPFGEQPFTLGTAPVESLAVRDGSAGMVLVAAVDGQLLGRRWAKQSNFITGEVSIEEEQIDLPRVDIPADFLLISPDQQKLFVVSSGGGYRVVNLRNRNLIDSGRLTDGQTVTGVEFLLGGISLMVTTGDGKLSQWSVVRRGSDSRLTEIRSLQVGEGAVQQLAPEHRRKGLVVVDSNNQLRLLHTTAERELLRQPLVAAATDLAVAPRANSVLVEDTRGYLSFWKISNPHPEVSWQALWGKVWYESYREPDYVWQSSSASDSFEPKYSLTPLAFGTLKAAFYAMLLGAPLAICGAIFTAYFMAPALRTKVKPLIEMMEALPTVILGFLAGLWLAPFFERHLPGVFAIFLLMPVAILLSAYGWKQLPLGLRRLVPDGWEPVLLVPAVILSAWFCIEVSGPMERTFFGGDMRSWLTNDLGIAFDQRNALVVGVAMGFAVIPNIFSIAEDAIYSVPKHLSYGSLALGATPWQTLVGVVLPTASPGIFSALMIGMGRAVGETMIVLMATGNTPVMEANIFEGMRTLSANLAVEIGETEVDSTHYRVLFLAAFVLFGFTFIVNTVAEVVRQRLRGRYSVI